MDEKTAWDCFSHTGSVRDYLIYTQCKLKNGEPLPPQEDQDENRYPGSGDHGEARG